MGSALDILIRINQKMGGDDAIAKLKRLDGQLKAEEDRLKGFERQMAKAMSGQWGELLDPKKMLALSKRIDESKGKVGDLRQAFEEMGGQGAMSGGVLSQAAAAGPWIALATAIAAVGIAIAAITVKVASFALEVANAHRTMLLTISAISGSTSAGEANAAAIGRVAKSSAVAKEQVADMGKRLAVAGLSGKLFEATLKTVAQATALLGASAGSHIESILERSKALGHFQFSDRQLRGLGVSMGDVARQLGMTEVAFKGAMKAGKVTVEDGMDAMNKAMSKRFGGAGAAMMLDFGVQLMKWKENLADLFKHVNVEPFLKALQNLLSLFDENTASGKLLRIVAKAIFDDLFAVAGRALPLAKESLIGFMIILLRVYLFLREVKNAFEKAFGGESKSGIDMLTVALYIGKAAAVALLGTIVLLTIATGILAGALLLVVGVIAAPFILVATLVYAAIAHVQSLGQALEALGLPDLGGLAGDMMMGLINGILGSVGAVAAAMVSVGQAAMRGLDSVMHFGSPAKAMHQRGRWSGEGYAEGVEATEPEAHGALAGLAKLPTKNGAAGPRASSGGGAYSFGPFIIQGGESVYEEVKRAIDDIMEEHAIEAGAVTEPEPA